MAGWPDGWMAGRWRMDDSAKLSLAGILSLAIGHVISFALRAGKFLGMKIWVRYRKTDKHTEFRLLEGDHFVVPLKTSGSLTLS